MALRIRMRQKLTKKAFVIIFQNINKSVGIQLIITLYIKLQKKLFSSMIMCLFWCVHFDPLFRWDCACVCHEIRTGREGICPKLSKYQRKQLAYNWPSAFKLNFNEGFFRPNMTICVAGHAFILTPSFNRTVHTYVTS